MNVNLTYLSYSSLRFSLILLEKILMEAYCFSIPANRRKALIRIQKFSFVTWWFLPVQNLFNLYTQREQLVNKLKLCNLSYQFTRWWKILTLPSLHTHEASLWAQTIHHVAIQGLRQIAIWISRNLCSVNLPLMSPTSVAQPSGVPVYSCHCFSRSFLKLSSRHLALKGASKK